MIELFERNGKYFLKYYNFLMELTKEEYEYLQIYHKGDKNE